MRKTLQLMASAALMVVFAACANQDDLTTEVPGTGSDSAELTLNGDCDIYTLPNAEDADWTITDCPDWATPVKQSGTNDSKIQLYVESNTRTPLRKGSVTIKYANGVTRATAVTQTNDVSDFSLQRSYAAGWSFDIRTYNDIRGVRQQIFNTQRLKKDIYCDFFIEPSTAVKDQIYYGEDVSKMQTDIAANLNLDIKYNAFSLNLEGSFGRNTLSNSKRVFTWIRHAESIKEVSINVDAEDAADPERRLFTTEFAAMRQEVIDAGASDESIARLIEIYGTHYVVSAMLGGCFDYFYSTELNKKAESDSIKGAATIGFQKKFNIDVKGQAKYENAYNEMKTNTIERFEIKGGDALSLARSVEDGTIGQAAIKAWKASLDEKLDNDGNVVTPAKFELVSFQLVPIQGLFPTNECNKITNYINRMYYNEMPLTRGKIEKLKN